VTGRDPSFAEFEPERLSPPRRRFDPLAIGSVVVVIAVLVAIVKPWEERKPETAASSSRPNATNATATTAAPATTAMPVAPDVPITWDAIAAAIRPHDQWGLRAIVPTPAASAAGAPGEAAGAPGKAAGALALTEYWVAAAGEVPSLVASPIAADQGVAAIGLTFPPDQLPLDARVLQATSDGWRWVPTPPLDPSPAAGSFLWLPPVIDGVRSATWPGGAYRIDVLTGPTIHEVDVDILGRFEISPDPGGYRPATPAADLVDPFRPDLGPVSGGLFIVVGGVAVGQPSIVGPALDAAAAWTDTARSAAAGQRRVPVVRDPGVNGIGFMVPAAAIAPSAELVRLLPETPVTGTRRAWALRGDAEDQKPYVIIRAPGGRAWDPGLYRLDVTWDDAAGPHEGSVHLEIRPDPAASPPTVLGSLASLATVAGRDAVVGTEGPMSLLRDLECPAAGDFAAIAEPPTLIGLGHVPGAIPTSVRAEAVFAGIQPAAQPLVLAREPVEGLTILAPATSRTFAASRYRLTIVDANGTHERTMCPGVTVGP
jgi:hypothetical protein